ncbi:MAG TPA: DNA-processing protein DprA [Candidatus Hydrogenedentes bacterium]|nr:DNA-processing protein DprA [Candidatus Hydrogenedentota bacterium]HPG66391.1 DNA-processing protein DprA [Candidatus Hydrogenedentota bacterium]
MAESMGRTLEDLLKMKGAELAASVPEGAEGLVSALAACSEDVRRCARLLLSDCARRGVQVFVPGDLSYPERLVRDLGQGAPALLFVLGDVTLLDRPAAAIAGAREVSPRGARLAGRCATALVSFGATIVSGGAQGVDVAAHHAALRCGGSTIVVLPQGLLTYQAPLWLARRVKSGDVAVVSQFAPGAAWETYAAVARNATISALANLVCVIEPRKTGGSIRTARHAMSQRKPLFIHESRCVASETVRLLYSAGASRLADEHGHLDETRLRHAWTSYSVPVGQMDMPEQET